VKKHIPSHDFHVSQCSPATTRAIASQISLCICGEGQRASLVLLCTSFADTSDTIAQQSRSGQLYSPLFSDLDHNVTRAVMTNDVTHLPTVQVNVTVDSHIRHTPRPTSSTWVLRFYGFGRSLAVYEGAVPVDPKTMGSKGIMRYMRIDCIHFLG
jgi:hypothetical protein